MGLAGPQARLALLVTDNVAVGPVDPLAGVARRRGRADRAEQIGVVKALVGGLPWPRSAPCLLPNLAVLLTDAGLIPRTSANQISTHVVSGSPSR